MKKLSIITALMLSFTMVSNAAKWRVNNNAGVSADFSNPQLAHDAATAGDTIYIEGSAVGYGNLTLTKQLYIFGPGYFLAENDSTQANPAAAIVSVVTFNIGSAGSLMSGLLVDTRVDINESNITIKRNRIDYQAVQIQSNASNVMILQNYITCTYASVSYDGVEVNTGSSNVFIQNNYIQNTNVNTSYNAIQVAGTASAQITNNVIDGNMDIVNSTMNNNIIINCVFTGSANSYNNNVCDATQLPVANNNQLSVDMLTVFDSTQTSTDAQWKLIAGSPALNAGLSSEDCGMYGGLDPYRLSGMPPMPSIFFFQAPSSGSAASGLPVNIKIKSNN